MDPEVEAGGEVSGSIDVVVPVYRDVGLTRACLESVLALSGPRLGRLIVVDDRGPEPEMRALLASVRASDARVRLLENEQNLGFVGACNRGLALREGDVVILNNDTRVTEGWLDELAAAFDDPAVGAACPLSNNATLCSVPLWGERSPEAEVEASGLRTQPAPRFTELPTGVGFCMLMRGELLELFGGFDPAYGRGYNEENDWCQRIRAAGFKVVRANHALVLHRGEVSFQGERATRDVVNARRLVARYPNYLAENAAFEHSLDAHVAALAQRGGGPVQHVGVDTTGLRAEREPEWALAAKWFETALATEEGVLRHNGRRRGSLEILHVLGFPSPEALRGILRVDAHLVHSHFDVTLLEGRPDGLGWGEVMQLRATAFALWQSATVAVPSQREARAIEAFLGAPCELMVVDPSLFSAPGGSPGNQLDVLAISPRFTRSLLLRLLDAWRRSPPVAGELVLGIRGDRLPPEVLARTPRVRCLDLSSPTAREYELGRARVLLVPPGESAEGPDASRVLACGGQVVPVDRDPETVAAQLFAPATPKGSVDGAAVRRWSSVYRLALDRGAKVATRRRRLTELSGLFL